VVITIDVVILTPGVGSTRRHGQCYVSFWSDTSFATWRRTATISCHHRGRFQTLRTRRQLILNYFRAKKQFSRGVVEAPAAVSRCLSTYSGTRGRRRSLPPATNPRARFHGTHPERTLGARLGTWASYPFLIYVNVNFCAYVMFSRKRLPSPFSSQDEEDHHASEEASFD
jgi:hypothetical protein